MTGGAAIVTLRLMNALRQQGIDARMIVVEQLSDSPHVTKAAGNNIATLPFLAERLKIYLNNGRDRNDLFKIDIASHGLPLHRHKWVKEADIICLNWINQGMLSLSTIAKISQLGKPIVWTMHDMWNMTGICHHAATCTGYLNTCGSCHLLHSKMHPTDLSHRTWLKKQKLYQHHKIHFVAVSRWLAQKASQSSLLADMPVSVIPNAFPIADKPIHKTYPHDQLPITMIMGAARLDDPIKGFTILIDALKLIDQYHPKLAQRLNLITFGDIRDKSLLDQIPIPHTHHGLINEHTKIIDLYTKAHIVLSPSLYETLPGTLVEGQAYGCIPVAFDSGGQADIITHKYDGYLATFRNTNDTADSRLLSNPSRNAEAFADGITWAASLLDSAKHGACTARSGEQGATPPFSIAERTHQSVLQKFAAPTVARQYITLFKSLLQEK